MPTKEIQELRLKKLKAIMDIMDEGMGKKEFLQSFDVVVELFKKAKKTTEEFREEITNLQADFKSGLESDNSATKDNQDRIIKTELASLLRRFSLLSDTLTKELDKKLSETEESIISKAIEGVEFPEPFVHPSPEDHRDGLEGLKGKERLDVSAIKGLTEEFKKLRKSIKKNTRTPIFGGAGGGGYSGGRSILAYDLSPHLDGSTKTFSLPAFWRIIMVESSSSPGSLRKSLN